MGVDMTDPRASAPGRRGVGPSVKRRAGLEASRLVPPTRMGRWTVGLWAVHLVAMLIYFVLALTGDMPSDRFFDRLDLAISLLVGAGAAFVAGIVGAISIFRAIDRSPVVVLATALSSLPSLFFLGELLSVIGILPSH